MTIKERLLNRKGDIYTDEEIKILRPKYTTEIKRALINMSNLMNEYKIVNNIYELEKIRNQLEDLYYTLKTNNQLVG